MMNRNDEFKINTKEYFWSILFPLFPLVGLILSTVTTEFILGEGSFWRYLISDRAAHVAGYSSFIQDAWRLNILSIPNLSIPEGTSVTNSDSIPLVSLVGKLIKLLTGSATILFGVWYVFCWLANGFIGILIARQFGVMDIYRLSSIALIFGSMPFWFMRWYHLSLLAHFLILLAFLAYFFSISNRQYSGKIIFVIIGTVSAFIHPYLWAMTMILGLSTGLKLVFEGKEDAYSWLKFLMVFILCGLGAAFFVGYFNLVGSSENTGYRHFSTNLLSPFYSNRSFLFSEAWDDLKKSQSIQDAWPFFANQRPDATGGQYEGMVYLGLGGLLLLLFALVLTPYQVIFNHLKKHRMMLFTLVCLALFAVSPLVTVGSWQFNLWEPGERIASILSMFRAGGRFFWPLAYFVLIGSILLVCRSTSRRISTVILMTAAAIQIIDTTPMRAAIAADAKSGSEIFSGKDWQSRFENISRLIIVPSFECGSNNNENPKSFIQALAAINGVVETNSASQARKVKQCETDYKFIESNLVDIGVLYVFFDAEGDASRVARFVGNNKQSCWRFERGWYCRR